ncbi:L-serine ammonia-lyase [Microbacterium aurantiacum]|uniref:L-serine dehydratase n=1 Tax=Microbacterium aurantiacum TaxID=162393 RepID=A0AAJ2LYI6_9MICO|nr:L-serine ammonia-lyase [Microbacterium aurantiacum]MDS0244284.1 L-serine ammonia-lyase [Microbacterium aurantiacum]
MISALDLFSIGIGPSSSHTVGPMRAARRFVYDLDSAGDLPRVTRVTADLLGSLGATGKGHGSDRAVVFGLLGERPESIRPDAQAGLYDTVADTGILSLAGTHEIPFSLTGDLTLHLRTTHESHPNAMVLRAFDGAGALVRERTYFSIGGGFITEEGEDPATAADDTAVPHPFRSAADVLEICAREGISMSELMRRNELARPHGPEIDERIGAIWQAMRECIDRGIAAPDGSQLPGGLGVWRRAPGLHRSLTETPNKDELHAMEWVNLFAMAVNEENAAGGRVVTAPTNGAAGIIPAVLGYYMMFIPGADAAGVVRFLLAAAAVGTLFKANASIAGAEVGCQGEVGSACSMAAAGLAEVLGGTPAQVENAAEIAIEHNLGLTCDPVGGLVQVPCIERNAVASVKAINAARMALRGNGVHRVSLDQAIKTMKDTGADMMVKYKETSLGGLAVNVVEC